MYLIIKILLEHFFIENRAEEERITRAEVQFQLPI